MFYRQDNAIFLPNVRSENGVLYIDNAQTDNQGVYICQAPITDVAPVQLLVTVIALNPEIEEANITVSADRLKIPTGGSGTVDCNPVGRPAPLIKWSKVHYKLTYYITMRKLGFLYSTSSFE